MTWQDDLQHLDAELAAGRITAEEYRARRDALGRAQGEQSAPNSPSGGTPQQSQSPFPPAFSWGDAAAQGAANSEESTQVVRPPQFNQPGPSEERTQHVSPVQQPQAQQPPPAQQPPAQPWPNPQPWAQQGWSQQSGTPWGDADLPPTPEHGDTSWMRQGPEVFETAGKPSQAKRVAGISIGAVLAAGLVVALVFYFTTNGGAPEAGPTEEKPPPPTSQTSTLPEPPPAAPNPPENPRDVLLPPPPGPKHAYNGSLPPDQLKGPKQGLLNTPVRNYALQNGMKAGWFNGTEGPPQVTLLAVRMPGEDAASKLTQHYLDDQEGLSVDDDLSYQGVEVVTTGDGATLRTAYTSHDWTVIVAVHDPRGSDATKQFTDLLQRQLEKTPPTVRE